MTRMIETPVSASPAMIARSIGAAPRQRGSSDGWTLSSSSSREQRLADQLAEGADDAELGLGGADPLPAPRRCSVASVRRTSIPSSSAAAAAGAGAARRPRPRRRSGGVTTSAGRCGGVGEPAQDGGGEVRGAEVDDPHPSSGSGLGLVPGCSWRPRAAPAARPCAARASVRSRIRTPSRWSISCWSTRASSPEASSSSGSPLDVEAADPGVQRRARRRRPIPGRLRQPSSAVASSSESHSTCGLTTRGRRGVRAGLEDQQPAQRRRAGSRRGRRPSRRA